MVLIKAKLKCGCAGHERLDHDFIGIRFLVESPCARHRARQWLDRDGSAVEWRDETQSKYWTRALELRDEWFAANAEALARDETPKPGLIAFQVERLRAEGLEPDDPFDD